MKTKPIPEPTEELKEKCNAHNQFSNFDRLFRSVLSVPKAVILKEETRERHRNMRKRAKKERG